MPRMPETSGCIEPQPLIAPESKLASFPPPSGIGPESAPPESVERPESAEGPESMVIMEESSPQAATSESEQQRIPMRDMCAT